MEYLNQKKYITVGGENGIFNLWTWIDDFAESDSTKVLTSKMQELNRIESEERRKVPSNHDKLRAIEEEKRLF